MIRDPRARTALLAGTAAAYLLLATPALAQSGARSFDIPAQDAASALNAWARQSNIQIVFPFAAIEGRSTPAVTGRHSVDAALDILIASAGLEVASRDENRVVLRVPPGGAGAPSADESAQLAELVVTGSLIRGAAPAGAHLRVIDEEAIRQTGMATVADAVGVLPQNVRGRSQDAAALANQSGGGSVGIAGGTSLNLRGVGADATLVLLNGRRLAPSGYGEFVDVSAIPLGAVSRIEVLADGASATYGSDAMAGVVNLILKSNFTGLEAEVRAGFADGFEEHRLGLTGGLEWTGGRLMAGVERYERGDLAATARDFTSSDDLRRFGGRDYRLAFSAPGNIISPGVWAGAIPSGQNGIGLQPSDILKGQTNFTDAKTRQNILPRQDRTSVFFSGEQSLGALTAYADGLYSDRKSSSLSSVLAVNLQLPATNYYRALSGFSGTAPLVIAYSPSIDIGPLKRRGRNRTYSLAGGLRGELPNGWGADAFVTAGRSLDTQVAGYPDVFRANGALARALASGDPATAFNPFGDGDDNRPEVIAGLLVSLRDRIVSKYRTVNAKLDGGLMSLPGGEAKFAVGGEYRWENFNNYYTITFNPAPTVFDLEGDRRVGALFGELFLPIFSDLNALPGVERLEFSVSGRYDHYSDFGDTFNPKVGGVWSPADGVEVHASWGTSFKAPRLNDLYSAKVGQLIRVSGALGGPDPNRDGVTSLLLVAGGNADLTPEKGEARTFGVRFKPSAWPGFSADVTYFKLSFDDRISRLTNIQAPFADPIPYLGSVYFPNPDQTTIDRYLVGLPDIAAAVPAQSPIEALVVTQTSNVSRASLDGVDLDVAQNWATRAGQFTASLNASWYMSYRSQFSATAPRATVVDIVGQPVDLRVRAGLVWSRDGWSASAFANYSDDYVNNVVTPQRRVKSQTTVDLQAAYALPETAPRPLAGLRASVSVTNLFDQDPPFAEFQQSAYDATNFSPVGRMVAVSLSRRW